jgi:ubiquinone/menaquinone biosynthesis C-methylase UbiE
VILPVHEAAQAYDAYAPRYDRLLDENRINAYMRRRTQQVLLSTFESGSRLIELGCGTGDEAIALAAHGCEIFAFDPSPRMVAVASQKAAATRTEGTVRWFVGRSADLARQLGSPPLPMSFDGAYASFSLSYERDLSSVSEGLAPWIRSGGQFVVAAMNRVCGAELAAAFLSGHPGLAGRRLAARTLHKVGEVATPVFPRTMRDIAEAFREHFVLEQGRALPAILPPPYFNRMLGRWPALVEVLARMDPYVGTLPVVRSLGDHNLLRFRRRT